jgi:dihydropyrimidine dehydrogenase (NAD+) subunit PreA
MAGQTLGVSVNGFELINPFILASAPPTASIEMIRRGFDLGWGGVVTKTIKPDSMEITDVSPRFHAVKDSSGKVIGFENIELVSKRDEDYWERGIVELKRDYPERMVIASLMGDGFAHTWQSLAAKMERAGADALELNFSCPHGMPEKGVGMAIGQDPEISAKICSWVKAATRLPVIVKLTPNVTDISAVAKAVEEAGADALAAINTVQSISGVDLDSMTAYPLVHGKSAYGGYSGAGIKPIGLKAISQLSAATGLPLYGMGGIRTWKDAAEYIALGASAVQVCTEVMVSGFGIVKPMIEGLAEFLEVKGYESPADFRGAAARKMSAHEGLTRAARSVPAMAKGGGCVKCGKCVTACADGGYQAISLSGARPCFDLAKSAIEMVAVPALARGEKVSA